MPREGAELLISSTSSASPELDLMGLMQNMLLVPRDAPFRATAGIRAKRSQRTRARRKPGHMRVGLLHPKPACVSSASPKHGPCSGQTASAQSSAAPC